MCEVMVAVFLFCLLGVACENTVLPTQSSEINCVPITSCPSMYDLLKNRPVSRKTIQYILDSSCGFEGLIQKVWCEELGFRAIDDEDTTVESTSSLEITMTSTDEYAKDRFLYPKVFPKIEECGRTGTQPNKILGGEAADLDEHPWSVLLLYERPNGEYVSRCGGVLISKRHVLTAAHCINPRLTKVILGEYDTSSEVDCITYPFDNQDCADPPLKVPIKTIHTHHSFLHPGVGKRPFYDDISLIELEFDVQFTAFIKPICLPAPGRTFDGETFTITGWGKTENGTKSEVKQKVNLPKVPLETCSARLGRKLQKSQICAGGEEGKDSCTGDSGGPLMYYDFEKDCWFLAGLVSIGTKGCGKKNIPGIYTYVPEYLEWIYTNAEK